MVGRLVEHDHVVCVLGRAGTTAVVGEHLGERDSFCLTPRQLVGAPIEQGLHAERRGHGRHLPAISEIVRNGAGGKYRILFEHRDPSAPTEPDLTAVGLERAGEDPQERGLARPVHTNDGDPITT